MSEVTQGEDPRRAFEREDREYMVDGGISLIQLSSRPSLTRLVYKYAPPSVAAEAPRLDKSDIAVLLPSEPTIGIYQVLRDEVLAVAQDAERHRAK